MNNLKDTTICIYGFLTGLIIQVISITLFQADPFDSPILLILPGIPALLMTLYRPYMIWKWLIASTLCLPLSMFILMGFYMKPAEMEKLIFKFTMIGFAEGFIMSLGGVLIGWGIRKGVQKIQLYNKSLLG